jgi:hypothetical protein
MNLFQAMALAVFVALAAFTFSAGMRGARKRVVAFWLSVWFVGSVAVVWPRSTAVVARSLGIGRGADLLLYLSVLVMFIAFFYVYGRFRRIDRQLTQLVRRLAIQNAAPPLPASSIVESRPSETGLPPEHGSA